MFKKKLPIILSVLFLGGCAAAMVPATWDPAIKLNQARQLWREGRVIPAERLILDSIELSREQNNYLRLGEAQMTYAQFLKSPAFRDRNFDRKRAELGGADGVHKEAVRYLKNAEQSYVAAESAIASADDPLSMSNLWIRRSLVYQELGDRPRTCSALENALAAHQADLQRKPDLVVLLPPGFRSFEEFIQKQHATNGCS